MEWTCPACGRQNTNTWICPDCGFERSQDYERYPTLTSSLPAGAAPSASLAAGCQEQQSTQASEEELKRQVAQAQAELEQLRAARQERERQEAEEAKRQERERQEAEEAKRQEQELQELESQENKAQQEDENAAFDQMMRKLLNTEERYQHQQQKEERKRRQKKKTPKIIAAILTVVILVGAGVIFINISNKVKMQEEIESIIDNATVLANSYDYEGAIAAIEAGLNTYPDSDELEEKRSELLGLQADFEVSSIIAEAEKLAAVDDYEGAILKIEAGLDAYPNSSELEEKRGELLEFQAEFEVSSIIDAAEKLAADDDYEGAILKIETGLDTYPNSSTLQSKLIEYTNALDTQIEAQMLADAQSFADVGDYETAMSLIQAAQEAYGTSEAYETAYAAYHKEYSLSAAKNYADSDDYASAITLLSDALEVNVNDVELISLYNTYCDNYVELVLADANSYYAEWEIDEAIATVQSGLTVLPDNAALNSKLDELNASKPISITSLTSLNSSMWNWNEGSPVDPFGNDYSGACNFVIFHNHSSSERSIEYRIYGNYQMLTGVIAPHADIGEDITCTVLVYADEELVYSSSAISQKTDSFTFAADISGTEYVKIVVRFSKTTPWDYFIRRLIISDVQLWP